MIVNQFNTKYILYIIFIQFIYQIFKHQVSYQQYKILQYENIDLHIIIKIRKLKEQYLIILEIIFIIKILNKKNQRITIQSAQFLGIKVVNLIILGVGKSSFHRGTCSDQNYQRIESNTNEKIITLDNFTASLLIQEQMYIDPDTGFSKFARQLYRKADFGIIICDVTNLASFQSLQCKLHELYHFVESPIEIVIIGNKIDQKEKREITSEQGYYLLKNLGLNIMKSQLKQKVLRRLEIEEAENRNNENLKTIQTNQFFKFIISLEKDQVFILYVLIAMIVCILCVYLFL